MPASYGTTVAGRHAGCQGPLDRPPAVLTPVPDAPGRLIRASWTTDPAALSITHTPSSYTTPRGTARVTKSATHH